MWDILYYYKTERDECSPNNAYARKGTIQGSGKAITKRKDTISPTFTYQRQSYNYPSFITKLDCTITKIDTGLPLPSCQTFFLEENIALLWISLEC